MGQNSGRQSWPGKRAEGSVDEPSRKRVVDLIRREIKRSTSFGQRSRPVKRAERSVGEPNRKRDIVFL